MDPAKSLRAPQFPLHDTPRVWFLTNANCPIGVSLSRALLAHGDFVVAGVWPRHSEEGYDDSDDARSNDGSQESASCLDACATWKDHLCVVPLDVRIKAQCQSAVAEAVRCFRQIDILFCNSSEVVLGTVEELSQDTRTMSLARDQFETNFFGNINMIKASLPIMRETQCSHIILLTAITGHIGTPGLSMYCASQWAIEGWCDSLAYEIAPFNIKMTIVQPNLEVNVLTNRVTSAPPMECYTEEVNPAPLSRNILSLLLDRIEGSEEPTAGDQLHSAEVKSVYPDLGQAMKEALVAETVYAVTAIGGHDNPPARHIVGHEAIASVKAKLKTVNEELEEFVECSCAVDLRHAGILD
ncbi:NAD(P)-binding protein [Dissoconium aciculare CBS 342.82]|uniref:NAD(P)-binding protein n=1 Tax=Dissoconium aciculare CBS 342.82 TaxID=1314786 RepID=A0A6J3MI26_9PEZI|nr:NAD(P)-binding protein [Dissoconium aciculare CBS 342.82]KAF1827548.1 NAD(P)-binding protein [Dissoconium aciculare CBS 342.82]